MPTPTLERERALWAKGYQYVAGVDEVGRGPLAGPVVTAAVVFDHEQGPIEGLRDSKKMTAKQRDAVSEAVRGAARAWAIGAASVREIDRRNIRRATALAMQRAVARLSLLPDYVIIDGRPMPELEYEHDAIVGGDATSMSIAGASVIAKCVRDHLMELLDKRYPGFGWGGNKGYGTAAHMAMLDDIGPTPHHRRSFAPVLQPRLL
jgi:ribonuclease HII